VPLIASSICILCEIDVKVKELFIEI